MLRDIGVELNGDEDFETQNQVRKEQDTNILKQIMNDFQAKNIPFNQDDFTVLAQPDRDDEEFYWESITDFLTFLKLIVPQKKVFSGQFLIDLFKKTKESIIKIPNLDDLF